jgi:hypothetical protein
MAPALMVCWIDGGAGGFLLRFLLGGAGELRGRRGRHPASSVRHGFASITVPFKIAVIGDSILYHQDRPLRQQTCQVAQPRL